MTATSVPYTEKDDRNRVIYHNKSDETAEKICVVLRDAKTLKDLCGTEYDESSNYQLLLRILKEQSEASRELAETNNVILEATNLTGRKTEDLLADFEFNESGTGVIKCPGGYTPKSCSCSSNGQCTASFHRSQCESCPYMKQCHPKVNKRTCRKTVSQKSKQRAEQQRHRSSDEFKKMSAFRNGVETIPSILRRKYQVDRMPVRGKIRTKLFFILRKTHCHLQ